MDELLPGTADLWAVSLDAPSPGPSALAPLLSTGERARAERFASPRDAFRFIVGRAWLRLLLARYVGRPARALEICLRPQGKPALAGGELEFNLAHSGGIAVCAIAGRGHDVGVDVEYVRPLQDVRAMAGIIFSSAELAAAEPLSEPDLTRRVLEAWVCKEALLKARGTGFDRPPADLELERLDGRAIRVIEHGDARAIPSLSLRLFEPRDGFVGAVALPAGLSQVRQLEWQWS